MTEHTIEIVKGLLPSLSKNVNISEEQSTLLFEKALAQANYILDNTDSKVSQTIKNIADDVDAMNEFAFVIYVMHLLLFVNGGFKVLKEMVEGELINFIQKIKDDVKN